MSHRTLLAVAAADGYDCREVRRVPGSAAAARRLLAECSTGPGRLPTVAAVLDAVDYGRHETLIVVASERAPRRYSVLPGALAGFRSSPEPASPDGGALVAVADDREDAEFRRLWDGARCLAAVAVDEGWLSSAAARRLLAHALERLTHDRAVVDRLGPGAGTSDRL